MKGIFEKALDDLDFVEDFNIYNINADQDDPYIKITLLETKKLFPDVAYVYFRKFEQPSRPPLAQVYIFDFSNKVGLPINFGETVKNIWLTSRIPLIYAFTQTDVTIISGYNQPKFKDSSFEFSIVKQIKIAALSQQSIFSAKKLDNGSFWDETKYSKHFKFKNSSYEILLKKLKDMLEEVVDKEQILDKETAKEFYQKLLLRSILVKYLEERTDVDKNRIFPDDYFQRYSETEDNFISVLKKSGALIELFKQLEKDFNGNIFELSDDEIEILSKTSLNTFVDVFDAKVDEYGQLHIWDLYSFNYLPIELISNIYEEFLPKAKGVVYTPPFIVDFLVDKCMPLQKIKGKEDTFKVIDPSCGSGVFLVAAYKRLVQAWRLNNNWAKPSIEVLKDILKNCIHGIDVKEEAIQLAAFSLTIALCDQLAPKKIRELHFNDLTESNLIANDFFSIILNENNKYDDYQRSFDLVIGNPPFEADLKNDADKLEKLCSPIRDINLPDKQIALLFLEQAPNLSNENGICCLIQKGGPLLYNIQSKDFSNYLFQNYNVTHVYDFSALKTSLFGKASVETTAVFIHNVKKIEKDIIHIVLQQTKANKSKIYLELDRYDIHKINRKSLTSYRDVWKTNLLGGGRLHNIVKDLSKVRSLKDFLDKKKDLGWKYAEGYIALTPKPKKEFIALKIKHNLSENEQIRLKTLENKYLANYLTCKPTISIQKSSNFTSNGIDQSAIFNLEEKYFYRKASEAKQIFSPPHILIRKIAPFKGLPVEYRADFLSFTSQVIGIHSPNKDDLIKIEKWIKYNKLLVFYVYLKSCIGLTSRPGSFLMDDILAIPYPKCSDEINLSSFEQILIDDVLDYQIEFRRKGEKAQVMYPATDENLREFSEIYLKVLNSVYKDFQASEPIHTTSFICHPFFFGERPEQDLEEFKNNTEIMEEHLESLIKHQYSSSLRINRIFRIYDKNVIYLIKPNQLRYWLKSIAIRDADETVADFIEQGL